MAKGEAMRVSARAKAGVELTGTEVVLCGDARPVIEGIAQTRIAGVPHDDERALAASARNGRSASQGSQRTVVSFCKGLGGLCEHRGGQDPSDAWQGAEDLNVAMLVLLPRVSLLGIELFEQLLDATSALGTLVEGETKPWDQQRDVSAGGFGSSRSNEEG